MEKFVDFQRRLKEEVNSLEFDAYRYKRPVSQQNAAVKLLRRVIHSYNLSNVLTLVFSPDRDDSIDAMHFVDRYDGLVHHEN